MASAVAAQRAPAAAAASAVRNVAPEPFFRHGDHDAVLLSPSGRYAALLVPVDRRLKLAVFDFDTRAARAVLAARREDYKHRRPHGALGHLTPSEYARNGQRSEQRRREIPFQN